MTAGAVDKKYLNDIASWSTGRKSNNFTEMFLPKLSKSFHFTKQNGRQSLK